MPFRAGEDKNLALVLPLQGLADGNVVLNAILEAQKKLFFPEICKTLETLKQQAQVYYTHSILPELLWDAYTALYQRLMLEAAQIQQGGSTAGVIQLIEAERFIWERLLDAPYGSMELIRGDEALQVIGHAISRLRRLEG